MAEPTTPPPRVLLADDQPDVLQALALLLKPDGYALVRAQSPAQVLDLLGTEPGSFDLLLMDCNYTRDTTLGQEGLDLLSAVRARDEDLRVVVMTAWGSLELAVEAMRRGAQDFVTKPWDNTRLLVTVRSQIELARALRDARDLRERMFAQEHAARIALEAKTVELERARESADEANREKSRFLAGMSHELRTPLTAIIGYSELLEELAEETRQPLFVPDLRKIQAAARHQLLLINEILDLSKIEAGKMTVFLEEFDVADLVRSVVPIVEALVAKRRNRLEVRCPPDIGKMRSDATKVRQILYNLLGNAAKFTDQGAIALTVRREPPAPDAPVDRLRFEVTDTGIGMTAETLARLFRPFTQGEPDTHNRFGGTGLGLAITRRFCELLGAEISVRSEPGLGSTFAVVFPVDGRS